MKSIRSIIFYLSLAGMLILWLNPRSLSAEGHGESESAEHSTSQAAEKSQNGSLGEGKASEESSEKSLPKYKLGKPLQGHFDINLLRSERRVAKLRYPLQNLVLTVRGANGKIWAAHIGCEVEFGSESGMAEINEKEDVVRKELTDVVRDYPADVLLRTVGKLRLKDDMAHTIDRLLETARVRRIYLTDFQILFIS